MIKRRLLMITYQFPPVVIAGAMRAGKFAKYLPEHGWDPVVLTTMSQRREPIDNTLLDELPSSIEVFPIPARKPMFRGAYHLSSWLPLMAWEGLWYFSAVKTGVDLIRQYDCTAIWSTALPPVCHLVGAELKRRTKLPLILDYRDLWSLNPYTLPKLAISHSLDCLAETYTLRLADAIVTISERMGYELLSRFGTIRSLHTIPNGYDAEDFVSAPLTKSPSICAHIGSIYEKRVPTTLRFLEGLAAYEQSFPAESNQLTVRFVGSVDPLVVTIAKKLIKSIHVEFLGKVTHGEAIKAMQDTSVLLLFTELQEMGSVTSKVYEYLASGRPILAIGEAREVVELLSGLRDCRVIDGVNAHDTARSLHALLTRHITGMHNFQRRQKRLDAFSRRRLAGQLSALLDSVVAHSNL